MNTLRLCSEHVANSDVRSKIFATIVNVWQTCREHLKFSQICMWCLQDIRQKTLYICVPYMCLPDICQKTWYILSSMIVFAEYSPET